MMWNDFSQFLAMGGYGLYVWGSLAACALVPLIEILSLAQAQSALRRNSSTDDDTNPP